MEDVLFLEKSLHINKLKAQGLDLESEDWAPVLAELSVSFDGSIMGVNRDKVEPFFADPEVRKFRCGYLTMPKSLPLNTPEDFYRMLAFLIPLEETA